MILRVVFALCLIAFTKPSEQEEFSQTTGSRPLSLAMSSAAYVALTMFVYPELIPFDAHGVPQHSFAISLGTVKARPAFRVKDFRALTVLDSKIVSRQEVKSTKSASESIVEIRTLPPIGRSAVHSGISSSPIIARSARLMG